jgi:hypothetical protein
MYGPEVTKVGVTTYSIIEHLDIFEAVCPGRNSPVVTAAVLNRYAFLHNYIPDAPVTYSSIQVSMIQIHNAADAYTC